MQATRTEAQRTRETLAIFAVALMFAWPAIVNQYPIVFSDTHAFLVQAGQPRMVWDKPWTYGPFLLALHGGTTLWLPLAAQVLIVSHLLWLLAASFGHATALRHVVLGIMLAAGSAAPWFASLLMPDVFAPITVIALYLLAFPGALGIWQRRWVMLLGTAAIAFHLTHLVLAAAGLAVVLVLRWRALPRTMVPLGVALAILMATNVVGFGRVAVSPYGSVFALARLTADGLVTPVLAASCPTSGWHLCDWQNRLPADSNAFLWDSDGPVWTAPGGAIGLAPEASAIVGAVIRQAPLAVLRTATANTLHALGRVALGDTLGPDWLEGSITSSLRAYFPPHEIEQFRAGLQAQGGLAGLAAPFNRPHAMFLVLGTVGSLLCLLRPGHALALMILIGVAANGFAGGALSGPFDRYQARIAWLVLLPPGLVLVRSVPAPRPRLGTCGQVSRNR